MLPPSTSLSSALSSSRASSVGPFSAMSAGTFPPASEAANNTAQVNQIPVSANSRGSASSGDGSREAPVSTLISFTESVECLYISLPLRHSTRCRGYTNLFC